MDYYEGDNLGSIKAIEVIEHFNLLNTNPVQIRSGSAWMSIPFKEESGKMNMKSVLSDNGRIYTYSGRFFFNNMRKEIEDGLSPYLDDVAVLRVTDMNGRSYLIGAPGSPVTIAENGDTGQRYINENGIEYTFAIEQSVRAVTT
jgi:hypothetical protein